jgi:hypothetical protein
MARDEPQYLETFRVSEIHCREIFVHTWHKHTLEIIKKSTLDKTIAVSIVLVLPPLSFCKNNQEKRVMRAGNRVRKMWCACENAAKRETDVDELTLAQNLSCTLFV